jgi:hypothetical protein
LLQEYIKRAEHHEQQLLANKRRRSREKIAPSAYMLFSADKRAELMANDPSLTFAQMGKMLGSIWANLEPLIKQVFYLDESL